MTGWGNEDGPESAADQAEAENGVRLVNRTRALLRLNCPVHPCVLCRLHFTAMATLDDQAGLFRTRDVEILGSKHEPPPFQDVPGFMDDLCDDVNRMAATDPIEAGAFALWRFNWIHPFGDGNGRTARALTTWVIFRQRRQLPPTPLGLDALIKRDVRRYYKCLEQADLACRKGRVNVSHMRGFLERLVIELLTG